MNRIDEIKENLDHANFIPPAPPTWQGTAQEYLFQVSTDVGWRKKYREDVQWLLTHIHVISLRGDKSGNPKET